MSKDSILFKTAERLEIQDEEVLQKTEEFLRSFQAKGSIKTLNDVAKTVLCLDLSCNQIGKQFDREIGIKLSGLKRTAYFTNLHNIEKILELYKPITIANLCIQLNCSHVKELAEEILTKCTPNIDLFEIHPQYVAAAVFVACKTMKIKIDQTDLLRVSRIKHPQWKNLISEFQTIMTKHKKQKMKLITEDETEDVVMEENGIHYINDIKNGNTEEDYEEWKARILREAYAALGKNIPETKN